ncbi:MAG: hypothetical protein QXR45_15350 [Candidatus Bathyarchaeia archaeon]
MTDISKKVVPYIVKGSKKDEEVNGHGFQIWNTKEEGSFHMFRDPESVPSRLCLMALNDAILRIFFFFNKTVSPFPDGSVLAIYPIILNYSEDLKSLLNQDSTKKYLEDIEKRREETINSLENLSLSLMVEIFKTMGKDPEFNQFIKSGRPLKEDLFDRISKRNRNMLIRTTQDFIKIYSELIAVQNYFIPILNAMHQISDVEANFSRLRYATSQDELPREFSNTLGKLTRIIPTSIDSICLECTLRAGLPLPYKAIRENSGQLSLETECSMCGGKTIFHSIKFKYKPQITMLFSKNFIQEFIIGYCLSRSDVFEKIYIHKNIQYLKDGPSENRQIDVFAKTNDGRVVLVEVTTQSDLNNIVKEVEKKIESLKIIPHDLLIYQTGAVFDQYLSLKDNCYIFTAKHVPKIEEHIEYLLKKQ